MTRLFSPVASRYDPEHDRPSLRRIFFDGSRLHLLFSLPLSLGLFFWGGALIRLWMGDQFGASAVVLQVLLVGHIVSFVQGIGGEILLGVGRHRLFALLSMAAAILNIVLSVILIRTLGLIGVAWGTTIPLAVLSLLYVPAAALRLVGGRWSDFLKEALGRALAAAVLPAVVIIWAADRLDSIAALIIWAVVALLVYLPGAYWLGLKAGERAKIRTILTPFFHHFIS
jgi:O-antigen/teichoic acid export membrane protein